MRYGFSTPNFGYCGDARVLAELAEEAELAGWDGFFLWDHLQWPDLEPAADTWVALAAIAMRTERIRLGSLVTPLPRRDIAKLAREVVTLDHLSNGRVVFGVGAGYHGLPEYGAFGHCTDPRVRAAMLDEGLAVLAELWSGKPVSHAAEHYRIETTGFGPPLQQPRVPIWVAATWPIKRPLRRAARWDGAVPIPLDPMSGDGITPAELRELVAYVGDQREVDGPFAVVQSGETRDASDAERVSEYAEAGATWWMEANITWQGSLEEARARLRAGPPRV